MHVCSLLVYIRSFSHSLPRHYLARVFKLMSSRSMQKWGQNHMKIYTNRSLKSHSIKILKFKIQTCLVLNKKSIKRVVNIYRNFKKTLNVDKK